MNQDAQGVQWLPVQEAWKKSAPLFALFYLSSLVASPIVSFFFSHLLLYLYTLVTQVLLFYLSAPVTFSYVSNVGLLPGGLLPACYQIV